MFKAREKSEEQNEFWVPTHRLPKASPSRFYELLAETLSKMNFAEQVWASCASAYAEVTRGGRPGIDPVVYFKLLMIGFFEGISSERRSPRAARTLCLCAPFSVTAWMKR